jgi:spore germination protein GerM
VTTAAERPPAAAPTPSDVPPEYVDSTYASTLWEPAAESACDPPDAHDGRTGHAVFFSCVTAKGAPAPAAAARKLDAGALPEDALRELLAGPTPAERAAGFVSNFGPETARLPFSVEVDEERRLAVVDLGAAVLEVEFVFVSVQDVAQVVSTVGQFEGIDRVVILVGGKPLCDVLEDCTPGAASPGG